MASSLCPLLARHHSRRRHRTTILVLLASAFSGIALGVFLFSHTVVHMGQPALISARSEPLVRPASLVQVQRSLSSTLVSPRQRRCSQPLQLLFVVFSSPYWSTRRDSIRASWRDMYNKSAVKIQVVFAVGSRDLPKWAQQQLQEEEQLFSDLLLLHDLQDSYHNLTHKLVQTLRWVADARPSFDYLVKCDDDSFVQISRLVGALREMACPDRLYWGYFAGHYVPQPEGRWQELNWSLCHYYLPYAMGGGYVLSHKLIQLLIKHLEHLILYNNEDVTMAVWLSPYNVTRHHDVDFNTEGHSRGCLNNYTISHKEKLKTMLAKRTSLIRNGTLCLKEREIRGVYHYNWSAPPHQCCHKMRTHPQPHPLSAS